MFMVFFKRFWMPALAAVSLALAAPAAACSVTSDYVRPSNFELVQIADAVVVVTAVEPTGTRDEPGVLFRIDSSIKGAGPASFTSGAGAAAIGQVGPSSSADLSRAHPEAYRGPCTRTTFRRGGRYLLFLERSGDGSWRQLRYPFARVNEDYAGEDDEWIRAIRRYAALQERLAPMEQLAALKAMVETKRDPEGAALSPAALDDIRAHLSLPSPWKPTVWLLEADRLVSIGEVPEFGLRLADQSEGGAADALAQLIYGRARRDGDPTPEEMRRFTLNALVVGDHPQAAPIFDAVLASPRPNPHAVGLALRFFSKHGQYRRAFEWIETKLMASVQTLDPEEAQRLIAAAITAQNGEVEGRPPPWRGDAHAAAVWPELALALHAYADRILGWDLSYSLGDAIGRIPRPDLRERPLLTLALARAHADGVADWAMAELFDETRRHAWEEVDPVGYRGSLTNSPAWLPLRVLLLSWTSGAEHEARLTRIFCQSKNRRHLLIAALGSHGGILDQDFLARIAATPSLAKEDRDLLAGAIIQYQARHAARQGEMLHWHLAENVLSMTGGKVPYEKEAAKPIVCPA
jgi:hypothetical protein